MTRFRSRTVRQCDKGESTLKVLMASAAGPALGSGDTTYWRSCNSTINALETVIASYNDMSLILDEAGLVPGGGRPEQRALPMRETAFRLSAGFVKQRFGDPTGPMHRLVYMLSTNRSILSRGGNGSAAETEAVADQLMTVPLLAEREHGIFDHCPPGFASTGAFAESLKRAASEHYGHALPTYLHYLATRRASAPDKLREYITRAIASFVQHVGADVKDGSQKRVAEAMGLVYAAGRLAKRAGVLPGSYKCRDAAKAVYDLHRFHGRGASSFNDRLRSLLRHSGTIDLAKLEIAQLTPEQTAACPVFLYTGRSGGRELVVPVQHIGLVFADWTAIRGEPDVSQRLQRSSDRDTRDRPIGRSRQKKAVYVFSISDLEAEGHHGGSMRLRRGPTSLVRDRRPLALLAGLSSYTAERNNGP